jgi:hypothetical protein
MPYTLTFTGGFFQTSDFLANLDRMVDLNKNHVGVSGRLLTVDGFSLAPSDAPGFPVLNVELLVTTYLTPAEQGVLGGATPGGPPPSVPTPATAPGSDTAPVPTAIATAP